MAEMGFYDEFTLHIMRCMAAARRAKVSYVRASKCRWCGAPKALGQACVAFECSKPPTKPRMRSHAPVIAFKQHGYHALRAV